MNIGYIIDDIAVISHGYIIHKPKAKHEMMLGPLAADGLISDHPACAWPKAEEKKQKKLLGDSQRYPMHSHRCGKPMVSHSETYQEVVVFSHLLYVSLT
jgi:hypothetical protein